MKERIEPKFENLEQITKGFKNADVISIIGKVGSGKSSLALNIVKNVVIKSNKNIAVYSLGTTSVGVIPFLIQITQLNLTSYINKFDFDNNEIIKKETSNVFLYIYDGTGITIEKLKAQTDNLINELKKQKHKLDLILIDYLQLTYPSIDNLYIDTEDKKEKILKENYDVLIKQFANTNPNEVMETNIKKLKEIVENYNIPIILVTMLSNNDEKRDEQRKIINELSDIVIEIENSVIKLNRRTK